MRSARCTRPLALSLHIKCTLFFFFQKSAEGRDLMRCATKITTIQYQYQFVCRFMIIAVAACLVFMWGRISSVASLKKQVFQNIFSQAKSSKFILNNRFRISKKKRFNTNGFIVVSAKIPFCRLAFELLLYVSLKNNRY